MASMMELLPRQQLADDTALRIWAMAALERKQITRSQWRELVAAFTPRLPVTLSLLQRTPKGVLYVYRHDAETARLTVYYLNHRAKWIKNSPLINGHGT